MFRNIYTDYRCDVILTSTISDKEEPDIHVFFYFPEQSGHSPEIMKFADSWTKPSARGMDGIGAEGRQNVRPQRVQWKCTCRSECIMFPDKLCFSSEWPQAWQASYFADPLPSSIICTSPFEQNCDKARVIVERSTVSSAFSISRAETGRSAFSIADSTIIRKAVGLTPCSSIRRSNSGLFIFGKSLF